jgi:hypothetical protein
MKPPFKCHSNAATNTITNSMLDSLPRSALKQLRQCRGYRRSGQLFALARRAGSVCECVGHTFLNRLHKIT